MPALAFLILLPLAVTSESQCAAGESSCSSDTSALLQKAVKVDESELKSMKQDEAVNIHDVKKVQWDEHSYGDYHGRVYSDPYGGSHHHGGAHSGGFHGGGRDHHVHGLHDVGYNHDYGIDGDVDHSAHTAWHGGAHSGGFHGGGHDHHHVHGHHDVGYNDGYGIDGHVDHSAHTAWVHDQRWTDPTGSHHGDDYIEPVNDPAPPPAPSPTPPPSPPPERHWCNVHDGDETDCKLYEGTCKWDTSTEKCNKDTETSTKCPKEYPKCKKRNCWVASCAEVECKAYVDGKVKKAPGKYPNIEDPGDSYTFIQGWDNQGSACTGDYEEAASSQGLS